MIGPLLVEGVDWLLFSLLVVGVEDFDARLSRDSCLQLLEGLALNLDELSLGPTSSNDMTGCADARLRCRAIALLLFSNEPGGNLPLAALCPTGGFGGSLYLSSKFPSCVDEGFGEFLGELFDFDFDA